MKTSEKRIKILHIVKKIIVWLVISCAALIVASLILSYVYRDTITNFVTQELLSQVNGEVTVEKIDISFLQSFPDVSIQLYSVLAKSTDGFSRTQFTHNCDTALYAKQLSLGFNIFDFFNQRYIVQNIQLNTARVLYVTDKQGNHNWNFIKPSTDTATNYFIDLSKIALYESEIILHLLPQQLYAHQQAEELLVEGDFFSDTVRCAVEGDLYSKFVELNGAVYARNYNIQLQTNIAINDENISIEKLSAQLPFLNCEASAKISTKTYIDANYTVHIPSFQRLQPELPKAVIAEIARYAIDGTIDVRGWCKGSITGKSLPAIEANVACEKGQLNIETEPLQFSFKTTVKTSDLGDVTKYQLGKTDFDATLKNSTANGTVTVSNLKDVIVNLQAQTTIDIADVTLFAKNDWTLEGIVKGNVNYKGSLLEFANITPDFFAKNTLSAQLQAESVTFVENEKSPFAFSKIDGKFNVQNTDIQIIDTLSGNLQNSNFFINGTAKNILPYLLCKNQSASFSEGVVQLGTLNIKPLADYINAQPATNSSSKFSVGIILIAQNLLFDNIQLKNVHTKLNYGNEELNLAAFSAQSVKYDKANLTNVKTELTYTNDVAQLSMLTAETAQYDNYVLKKLTTKLLYEKNSLQLQNTKCTFLNGTYEGQTQLTFNADATTHCRAEGSLKNMPIREIMNTFNNFDQTFLQAEQINGIATADFTLTMKLDKNNNVDYSTLQLQSKINVKNGEISNFAPFVEMGRKLKVEEFKNVTFTQIENTLTIKHDTVHIPRMDIKTNAFEMKFSGTHAITDNQFKYFMTLYLQKTLTNMFQKRNKTEEFGEIEQNTDGNILLPLKLFGTPEKFHIDYDFKTTITNVKQGVEQQRNEWRTILGGQNQSTTEPVNSTNQPIEPNQQQKPTIFPPKKNEPDIKSGFEIEYE